MDLNITSTLSVEERTIATIEEDSNKRSVIKEKARIAHGQCTISASTSHTQYFKKDIHQRYNRITTNEFCSLPSESSTASSDTFRCFHGKAGKQYLEKGLLNRTLRKKLDPIPHNYALTENCPSIEGWKIGEKIEFLIKDPVGEQHVDRLQEHLRDFIKISSNGFRVDTLDSLCVILDYLVDSLERKVPYYREALKGLLTNLQHSVILIKNSDVYLRMHTLKNFIGFLGYLLLLPEDNEIFELVSKGLLHQLSSSDKVVRHMLVAARHVLNDTIVRMIATATPGRFSTFVQLALILAYHSLDDCMELIMDNIVEVIFYRFNPYFPERDLPEYDINPYCIEDPNLQLGESSMNMQTVLSLLLVLVKTMKTVRDEDPQKVFPYPDEYAQRCFVWVYRYECRVRGHLHQRSTLTVITNMLIHIFGDRLHVFSKILMPDIMSLSVLTEIPRDDWTRTVSFRISQEDVQFKKLLIGLSMDFLKIYPRNKFMAESRLWIVGLMYLVDPGLSALKAKWSNVLFAELRKAALKALLVSVPLIPSDLVTQISLIRRLMWYIEWYTESPFEMSVLYWCVRLLQASLLDRRSPLRRTEVRQLIQTHGIIILMNLCDTLLDQKQPPVEKSQCIIALTLRVLTSCLEVKARVSCYVYPAIRWPGSINQIVRKMMHIVLNSLEQSYVCSDRWLLSLLNFIWEAIVWKREYRESFIRNNGIYKLLDIITLADYPVQCVCLAIICDLLRGGGAVAQVISWRANINAKDAHSDSVRPGSTICSLLAQLCLKDFKEKKIKLDENNVLRDLDFPLMSEAFKKYLFSSKYQEEMNFHPSICLAAVDIAGSLVSKCFSILHMLSQDLKEKVELADESYKLYKDVKLSLPDEVMLVLCAHYLTIKLNQAWLEAQIQGPHLTPVDREIMDEFLQIARGWTRNIQQMQLDVVNNDKKMDAKKERNLYSFLERVRLTTALDALRELRCIARSADRERITHALIHDAVHAYQRRSMQAKKLSAPVVRTYDPPLDDANVIGHNVKVINISPRNKPKKREILHSDEVTPQNSQKSELSHESRESQKSQGSEGSNSSATSFHKSATGQ